MAEPIQEPLYAAVRARAEREPELVGPVLRLLADPADEVDTSKRLVGLARTLAEERERESLETLVGDALTTAEVIARVRSWTDRRTVGSARRRGQLLGVTVGRQTFHPSWQFSRAGVRDGVEDVVPVLLSACAGDAVMGDVVMRQPRPELDGASLVDLLVAGRVAEITVFLARYREGFTA